MTDKEKDLKSVIAHQGDEEDGEKHVQGPIHGEAHPGIATVTKKSVAASQHDQEDDEVHVQGPIHG